MKRISFYVGIKFITLLLCINTFGQNMASSSESFESLKEKVIGDSKSKKMGIYVDRKYQRELFLKPFEKWAESSNPLEKDSFIYKMFYDRQTYSVAARMIEDYIKNEKNPPEKRQAFLNFLLKKSSVSNFSFCVFIA